MNTIKNNPIFIDPSSHDYNEDRLFDHTHTVLNRDDTLAPFIRLRQALGRDGIDVHTADYVPQAAAPGQASDYYSLGTLGNYPRLQQRDDVNLRAFVIFEPPVVDPRLYRALPALTAAFERVYIHNTEGDGYSLEGVDRSKLRKLYWPQPHKDVLTDFWHREQRLRRMVMINGNHKPTSAHNELYSRRIEALAALSVFGKVDLFGRGWERWWSRASLWWPYWRHRATLMSIYKGSCPSKFEVLSQYEFALCFENMAMKGYVTEKIFDCLYAGTIPLYLGAGDIADLIPENAYIDCRKFSSWKDLHDTVMAMSAADVSAVRAAGRAFIQGAQGLKYYDSLLAIFQDGRGC